jgi:serine/threonine protein phosphatase 1
MSASSRRVIAIGDVHGCAHALDALLEAIAPVPTDQLVFLGDLVDQGRDSRDVLDRLIDLRERSEVVLIAGNHEEMMLAARESEAALRCWEACGGVMTLNSYRYGAGLEAIPGRHWTLIESGCNYFETDDHIFTHANYVPDVPMDAQPDHVLRWSLFDPAEMRPHCSGKTVIVGHTEQASGEPCDLGFAVCIDTACWRYGWLTALDVGSGQLWQSSRWGVLRDGNERPQRQLMPQLAAAKG